MNGSEGSDEDTHEPSGESVSNESDASSTRQENPPGVSENLPISDADDNNGEYSPDISNDNKDDEACHMGHSSELIDQPLNIEEHKEFFNQIKEMGKDGTVKKNNELVYADVHLTESSVRKLEELSSDDEEAEEIFNPDSSSDESTMVSEGVLSLLHGRRNPYIKFSEQTKKEIEQEELETQHYLSQKREDHLKQRQRQKERERQKLKEKGLLQEEVQLSEKAYLKLIRYKQFEIEVQQMKSDRRIEEIKLKYQKQREKEKKLQEQLEKQKLWEKEEKEKEEEEEEEIALPLLDSESSSDMSLCDTLGMQMSREMSLFEQLEGGISKGNKYICEEYEEELAERARLQEVLFPLESKKQELEEKLLKQKRLKWFMKLDRKKRKEEVARKKEDERKGVTKIEQKQEQDLEVDEDGVLDEEEEDDDEEYLNFFMSAQPISDDPAHRENARERALCIKCIDMEDLSHEALIALEIEKPKRISVRRKMLPIKAGEKTVDAGMQLRAIETTSQEIIADDISGIKSDSHRSGLGEGKPIHKLNSRLFKKLRNRRIGEKRNESSG